MAQKSPYQIKPILYAMLFHLLLLTLFILILFYIDPQYQIIMFNSLQNSFFWSIVMLFSIVFSAIWLSVLGIAAFIFGVLKRLSVSKIVIISTVLLMIPYLVMSLDGVAWQLSLESIIALIFFLMIFPLGFYMALLIGNYQAKQRSIK